MRFELKKWKKISSRRITDNPFLQVDEDVVRMPNGAKKKYYISNRDHGAVVILATDAKKRVLIQYEFRYPVKRVIAEFPSGMIEKGETPLQAAKREFKEEAGYKARSWKKIGAFYASPSRTNLIFHAYHASDIFFVGQNLDFGEFLEHRWVSFRQLRQMVKNGTIKTQTVLATLYLFFH